MTIKNRPSLRKCIDNNCRRCIYDSRAAGTWRQQVTLCAVTECAIYPVRPITTAPIPETVLDYYQRSGAERAFYAHSRPQEGHFDGHKPVEVYPSQGKG